MYSKEESWILLFLQHFFNVCDALINFCRKISKNLWKIIHILITVEQIIQFMQLLD